MKMRGPGLFVMVLSTLVVLSTVLSSCGDDDDSSGGGGSSELGTFAGNIQVSDDPQTELGYLYNVKVTVTKNGGNATVKVVGDPGFSREYTGTITSQANAHDIRLAKQTKPSEKIVGDRVTIMDNELTIVISIANDAVSVKKSPSSTTSVEITGKLQMIGTNMLRE